MYKITNQSTTHIAVENVNLAPGQSTTIFAITASLQYLEHKRAVKIEPIKEVRAVVQPKPKSVAYDELYKPKPKEKK